VIQDRIHWAEVAEMKLERQWYSSANISLDFAVALNNKIKTEVYRSINIRRVFNDRRHSLSLLRPSRVKNLDKILALGTVRVLGNKQSESCRQVLTRRKCKGSRKSQNDLRPTSNIEKRRMKGFGNKSRHCSAKYSRAAKI
jgi:hypothetical protein